MNNTQQIKKSLFIILITITVIAIGIAISWYLIGSNWKKSPTNLSGKVFQAQSEVVTVQVPGIDKAIQVPPNYQIDFSNPYKYEHGGGVIRNKDAKIFLRIEKRSDTTTPETLIKIVDHSAGINSLDTYQLVDESKNLYRSKYSPLDANVYYFNKVEKDNIIYMDSFVSTNKRENSSVGCYFMIEFLDKNLSIEKKDVILQDAQKLLYSQF